MNMDLEIGGNVMVKYKMILLLCFLCCSACTYKPQVGSPWMQKILQKGPEGPPLFRQGWRDGCETGISATANAFQRHFYRFTQDYKLVDNPVYYSGWKNAFNYCQRYVFQYLRRNII